MPAELPPGPPAARSDEEIAAIWVGGRKRLDAPVTLVDYDPGWPALFEREATRIRSALGANVIRLEHVGSTSVPGLAAKPIIDIALEVPDSSDEASYVPRMDAAGYRLRIRERDWFEHRLFGGPDTDVNLHTFSRGCSELDVMVAFRDWLRAHDDDRALYEAAKRELAARTWAYMQDYADAKTEVVRAINARAAAGCG